MTDYTGEDRRENQWHLDKRVPIATIATLIVTVVGFTSWLDSIRNDVDLHWQAFQAHVDGESSRYAHSDTQNDRVLTELKEMRKDIVSIKVALARSGVAARRNAQ